VHVKERIMLERSKKSDSKRNNRIIDGIRNDRRVGTGEGEQKWRRSPEIMVFTRRMESCMMRG
jgi:hypothetical protein